MPLCRRFASANDAVQPVCGHGARQESGQRSYGADILLTQLATVQPGSGPGQDDGPKRPEKHCEPHVAAEAAHHADQDHVSQLVVNRARH